MKQTKTSNGVKRLFFASIFFLSSPILVSAQNTNTVQRGFLDDLACIESGSCGLNDIVLGFTLLIKWMLGGIGAVALVYFVYGGIQWVISGGNADRVKKGKDIMINTVFALFIAFASYLIVEFFVNDILGADEPYQIVDECSTLGKGEQCGDDPSYVCTGTLSGSEFSQYTDLCVPECFYDGLYNRLGGIRTIQSCIVAPQTNSGGAYDLAGYPIGSSLVTRGSQSLGADVGCPDGYACIIIPDKPIPQTGTSSH
ncbi:pilin [bacterium]|nr:pilin [bacterium]